MPNLYLVAILFCHLSRNRGALEDPERWPWQNDRVAWLSEVTMGLFGPLTNTLAAIISPSHEERHAAYRIALG
jgi:hypothetical protein